MSQMLNLQELKTCIQMQDMQILQNVLSTMNPQVTLQLYAVKHQNVSTILNQVLGGLFLIIIINFEE